MNAAALMNYFVATALALITCGSCAIPDYIHVCRHDDPDLGGCIKNSVESLRPRLKSGIPELEIPSIDPFTLDFIDLSLSSDTTRLKANISNLQAYGGSDFKIIKIIPTLTKKGYTFRFEAILPKVRLEGEYEIDSKILFLELQGKGPFKSSASDFHFECILKGRRAENEGKTHLIFQKMKCNAVVGAVSISMENLFNGNPVLGQATNAAINDNSQAFFEEIKPSLLNAIADTFTEISNKITLNFNYDELFP